MTTAAPRPTERARTGSAPDLVDALSKRTTGGSGWYDPDGAAWESEAMESFEAPRVTPVRPAIRIEVTRKDRDA